MLQSDETKEIPKENTTYDGDDIVQVVPSGPDISTDALYETLLNATILCAKTYLDCHTLFCT